MAIHDQYIISHSLRECKFYLRYIKKEFGDALTWKTNPAEMCIEINSILDRKINDFNQKVAFANRMKSACQHDLISSDRFSWIKSDRRACFWVWGWLINSTPTKLGYSHLERPNHNDIDFGYMKGEARSHSIRYEAIVNFFDEWNVIRSWKDDLLSRLAEEWAQILRKTKTFSWLDEKNEEQIWWAWKHIVDSPVKSDYLAPMDNAERYLSICTAFDLWEAERDSKDLFLHRFNKAWHQKKHRDNRVGKKSLNTYVSEDVKNKLETLALERGQKLHQVIESLINNEYQATRTKLYV
ncbi:hypothetical protein [Ferrimonas gelatinilytica]|uniref:Uncharacterized protein n=1 Tax=Ferrimonas gelatinilytica TaxID=1255257 RepID=A0ABP9SBE2_9GAMM